MARTQGTSRVVSRQTRMNGNPLPPKKEVALALLERQSVSVHLDPRATGVVVPAWFKRQPQLVLQVGLNMPVPIPDLRIDEDGMTCTLSFNRSPFFCIVPWTSVYAMVGDDGRGMIWQDDVPPEVALQGRPREGDAPKKPAASPALAVVKSAPEPAVAGPSGKSKPKRAARVAEDADREAAPRDKKARGATTAKTPTVTVTPAAVAKREAPPGKRKGAGPAAGPAVVVRRPGKPPAEAPSVVVQIPPGGTSKGPPPKAPGAAREKPDTVTPEAPAPPPQRPQTPRGGKPKREIPPYLRVVK